MEFIASDDADLGALDGRSVAVVGYGNLGRSIACNLRDHGVAVTVGNIDDAYRARAREEGFPAVDIAAAVAASDIVFVLVPDEELPGCFDAVVAPVLRDGAALVFASGYCLAYGLVSPPPAVDVLLVAPRMVGEQVRDAFVEGTGFVTYLSVEQDATGDGRRRLLACAAAAGCLERGGFVLGARDEALLDLFVEQTFGPVLGMALQAAFTAGAAAGLPPEALVLELYMSGEMEHTFHAFAGRGFYGSVLAHGFTAAFGGYLRSLDIDVAALTERFAAVADDIRSGGFARTFQAEQAAGSPTKAVIEAVVAGDDPMSTAEANVRAVLRPAD